MMEESFSTKIFGATIEFGVGIVKNLPYYIEKLNVQNLLLVTDEGIIKAGIIDKLSDILKSANIKYAIFSEVQPNPIDRNVIKGLEFYKSNNCDAILAVGGGSPMDVGKAIRAVLANNSDIKNCYVPANISGDKPILIAVPTTSGTGSEVSTGSIITDTAINRKRIIRHIPPSLAVIDPDLTIDVPPFLTSATGIDALSHNIEAYVSTRYNPLADAIAIKGIQLIAKNLRQAVKNGSDIDARKNMSLASMMGALAFNKGLGASHSLSHQLSTDANVHHGVANAIMLPYVMRFNLEFAIEKYADIAYAMGVETYGMSTIQSAKASIRAVYDLCRDIGLPDSLSAVNVNSDMIKVMAKKAMEDHCHLSNPRVCCEDDMLLLYKFALEGEKIK
ncbi:TPA: iron-containing alcohol dehydrogenase [Candidatus Poribacteria bacterium]|nr:iron-containing alcohol dehydrogenase [Candidatus Poribacteria bacterium]